MKTKFFLLGLCVLGLAACSVDEVSQVNDTNAIQFKATTATRATAATTNTIDGFTVWAWEKVDGTPEFMNGVQAVRASEGGSTFTTTHTYYWPGAALDFYAFIPAATVVSDSSADYNAYFGEVVDMSSDVIEGGTGTYSYNGYVANATITSPSEISFDMHVPADAAKGIDLGYAATLGQTAGTVGLNFRHALSQVAFKAMNGNADWTVDIQGVTLCGIFKEGTYTLPTFGETGTTEHNSSTATKGTWTVGDVQGRFDAGIAETVLEGTSSASQSITATDGALMLIPQTVAAWDPDTDPTNTEVGAYIRISCRVTDEATGEQIWPNYNEADSTGESPEYADITVPFEVDWEEGNLYTYTIVFGEGLGYYAPDDENTDLDGTPVLIPIRFTVDIDDFGNTDDVDVSTDTGGDEGEPEPDSLVLEYTTTEESTSIALPILSLTDVTVDWGDGSDVEEVSSDNPTHTYSAAGTYTVTIDGSVGELCSYVNSSTIAGADCLTAVKYWGNMEYTSFRNAFRNCTNLTSVPNGPVPLSTEATYADYMFQNDSSLISAPTFEGLSSLKYIGNAFENCASLASIPENLLKGCSSVTDVTSLFSGCTSLTSIPEGIFDSCTGITSITSTFYTCTNLEVIPTNILDNCRNIANCMNAFRNCTSLTVESPYTEIVVGGETVKVHLYERNDYPDEFNTFSMYTYNYCFMNCTFTDYDDIPSNWKSF